MNQLGSFLVDGLESLGFNYIYSHRAMGWSVYSSSVNRVRFRVSGGCVECWFLVADNIFSILVDVGDPGVDVLDVLWFFVLVDLAFGWNGLGYEL